VLARTDCLGQAIGLPEPAMSRHLRVLRESRLVEASHAEFDARVRIYSPRPGPMAELRAWLDQTEARWVTELAAFKKHVEGQ
jgi:DNA-binding transcriptional ArsR family regulator